jgi:hypothetical protein
MFGCSRPVRATNSPTVAGLSRSKARSSSSDSLESAASKGPAGNADARRAPRATPRISSLSSVSGFFVTVALQI